MDDSSPCIHAPTVYGEIGVLNLLISTGWFRAPMAAGYAARLRRGPYLAAGRLTPSSSSSSSSLPRRRCPRRERGKCRREGPSQPRFPRCSPRTFSCPRSRPSLSSQPRSPVAASEAPNLQLATPAPLPVHAHAGISRLLAFFWRVIRGPTPFLRVFCRVVIEEVPDGMCARARGCPGCVIGRVVVVVAVVKDVGLAM